MEICDGKKQQSNKPSRSPSPERAGATSPAGSASYRPVARTPPPARVGPPPSPPVPTNPVAPVAPEPSGPVHLTPCLVCGRTFVPQSLDKHVKICEKMLSKKRKTFDSSRQRREGTDLEQFLPKNFGLPENSPFLEKSPPNTAKTLPKTKPSVKRAIQKPTADLERCPHCGRAFGPRAFERHVEWCGDKAKILPPAPAAAAAGAVADAKQRLNARTQYRAPLTRGRRSSQTRDKSSNSRSASVESRGSPPRVENGDYRRGRTRASESVSSNDFHEETTPHVPVIRQAGARTNNSGDSHVRARQARLARDLSSTRVEDSYDPFLSAARQMKELMSSETNIPQKFNSTKDHNRTLPILRPNKDKNLLTNNRQDNSKTMKDSINRTYKKIPTLHRMKSFGSTNNDNNTSTPFGARCSSFRINRNNKSSSQSLNTTFTKSSKENISSLSSSFNRHGLMNRSFSSYNNSTYSTPKPRDKIPKISTSMSHSFQRTTIKQPTKMEKAKQNDDKKEFVNLDTILVQDNLSMTDSNYIDPRLINENDNLPINVNTIRNNPDIISSMESLLTTENLPAKFDSFANVKNNNVETVNAVNKTLDNATNNNTKDKTSAAPTMDDLTTQYDKIMSSLEQSIASKTSIRDDDSLCEDFDLEEFMTNFDDDIKQKTRICSSTTRIIKQSELVDDNRTSEQNSICSTPKIVHSSSNGSIPFNKSMSLNFSSNSIAGDSLFPSSAKRSTSLLDTIQKKNSAKSESIKSRHNADQLEQDIMKSLKDFGRFYESESQPHKEIATYNATVVNGNGTARRDFRAKSEKKNKIQSDDHNGYTPNGKSSNDSAYSSLNRISPSKLSVCNSKELNGMDLDRIPAGSDSSDSHRDGGLRSVSSDEFLAMERSAEHEGAKAHDNNPAFGRNNDHGKGNREEKRTSSRASHTGTTRRARGSLSSSGSESSVPAAAAAAGGGHRLSRFCHECGNRFPVHTAKFCIECGCKRLVV